MPPYVQTTLLGERQANDSRAMPPDDFMQILFPLQFQRSSFQPFSTGACTFSTPMTEAEINTLVGAFKSGFAKLASMG